jgi:hypothetical protein
LIELPSIQNKTTLQLHKEKEMVAFRKLFPALAIGAFLLGTATTASAQGAGGQPLVCSTDAGVPPVVRAESHTDLVGDIVLICTGGDPNRALTANFQLFLNTNITSRLLGGGLSEALLMIDEPGAARLNADGTPSTSTTPFCLSPASNSNSVPNDSDGTTVGGNSLVPGLPVGGLFGTGAEPSCNPSAANQSYQQNTYTMFRGQPATAANGAANAAVVWPGVPIVPPGTTGTRVVRITNIRANAAGVPASTSLVPTQIFSFLSISASQSLALNNPQQAVAFVLPGLQFDVRACNGGSTGVPRSFVQCVSEPGGSNTLFNNPSASGPFGAQLGLRFREGFQTAFKTRIETGQENSIPGVVYNTESGFVRTTMSANSAALGNVGVADGATRVAARFTNVPAGTRIFVTVNSVTGNSDMGSATAQATLISTDANGAGGAITVPGSGVLPVGIPGTTALSCTGIVGSASAAEVPLTNGAGMAVWEVTAANSANIDTLFFLAAVAYAANTPNNLPGLGQSSVTGSFAPFYAANSNANAASSSLPIPRFIDNATPRSSFRIDQCVTNLLFPFVTNQAGFDTGLAISNTSRDPFSGNAGRLQAGTCTINYYGATPGGPAPSAQTTNANVEAGNQLLFVLSSGGGLGITGTPGFQGYIIAQCRFQYAHGFAFITDGPIGQARVAEGYLALVMDEGITSRTGSFSEVLAH